MGILIKRDKQNKMSCKYMEINDDFIGTKLSKKEFDKRLAEKSKLDAPEKVVGRKLTRRKGGKQETRWVYDRTLGNDICWVDRWICKHQTPWAEFKLWSDAAKITG